jgi:hypothetical protein
MDSRMDRCVTGVRAVAHAIADAGDLHAKIPGLRRRRRRGRPREDERNARWRTVVESDEIQRELEFAGNDGEPIGTNEYWGQVSLRLWQRFRNDFWYPASKNDPEDVDETYRKTLADKVRKALQNTRK